MDTRNPESSWDDLARRAAAETPRPDIDVGLSVRRKIEAGLLTPGSRTNLLDEITRLWGMPALGAAAAAILLLAWQFAPAVREVAIAIELQSQLLAGL